MPALELVPPDEADRIANIVRLTVEQLKRRYEGKSLTRRGVHAKSHGCVRGTVNVLDDLPKELQVGVFAPPGRRYEAWIRFSNATVIETPDTSPDGQHESRGMAVKLLGVSGTPLIPTIGPITQDFLMINQPVFAFANVEDYEALSEILLKDGDQAGRFFADRIKKLPTGHPDLDDPGTRRALRTLEIVKRIKAGPPAAFQEPPASPLDNNYFSAAPFLFGVDRAFKFAAKPRAPVTGVPFDIADPDYLRTNLRARLKCEQARKVVFDFSVQVRMAAELDGKLETEVEDASVLWDEAEFVPVNVATIEIPPQDFDTPDQRAHCERLMFTPWHALAEHRPLGGINRLRKTVYEASAGFRLTPTEPANY